MSCATHGLHLVILKFNEGTLLYIFFYYLSNIVVWNAVCKEFEESPVPFARADVFFPCDASNATGALLPVTSRRTPPGKLCKFPFSQGVRQQRQAAQSVQQQHCPQKEIDSLELKWKIHYILKF